jgi:alpha-beta hydrolase superfamily lysophospholipase
MQSVIVGTAYFAGCQGRIFRQSWLPTSDVRGTVLLLHGYGEHLGLYDPLARRLVADGHAVHAMDAVGHGRSDGERAVIASFDYYVEDARRLADLALRQRPGTPLAVIGHSHGAVAALVLAQRHPQLAQTLILSGAPVRPLDWLETALVSGVAETEPGEPTDFLSTQPDYVHALLHDPLVWPGGFRRESMLAAPAIWGEIDAGLAEGRPDLPVLFVHGGADQVVPVGLIEPVVARLPKARLRVFPDDLHDVLNEHDRNSVYEVVAAFLATTLVRHRVA